MTPTEVWLKAMRDPVFFANTLLSKKPHPGQVLWLRKSVQPINVLVPGNRWGKSTVIAMKHIFHGLSKHGLPKMSRDKWLLEDYNTISVAMSADQAGIVFKEAKRLVNTPIMKPLVRSIRATPFPSITFYNGATIHMRSAHDGGRYIDGHKYDFLSVDEAGWVPDLKHLINSVLLMRLAGGGVLDLIGTPKGYGDLYWYYSRAELGMPGYYAQKGSIYDNPYLPPEDIKMRDQMLASADLKLRQQVLFGEFMDFEGLAFTRDQLNNAFDPEMPHETPYEKGHKYITAWDLGRTTDFTVGCTLDITHRPWRLVNFQRLNKVPWETIYAVIESVRAQYHCRYATIDATGPQGDVIEEEMTKRGIPVDSVKLNTKQIKIDLINHIQTALDDGRHSAGTYETMDVSGMVHTLPKLEAPGEGEWGLLRLPMIQQLMDELGLYRIDDHDLVQDSVMSLGLAVVAAYDMEAVRPPVLGGLYG